MATAGDKILSGNDAASVAETCRTYGLTTEQFALLRHEATAAKATAYCTYSQFRVGAALLGVVAADKADEAGATDARVVVVPGANVENASYPVGTCAERVAMGRAVTAEGLRTFRALAVSTDISPPASPCGMCRQFLREFCHLEMPIIMFDKNEDYIVRTMGELLPMSFGPEQLPRPPPLTKYD